MGPGVCKVAHPATWPYSLALPPRLTNCRSGRGGGSGCHVMPLGPSRCLAPRPSPNYHVVGEASGEGTQAEPLSMRVAPQLPLTAFNAVGADLQCRLTDARQSGLTKYVTGPSPVKTDWTGGRAPTSPLYPVEWR